MIKLQLASDGTPIYLNHLRIIYVYSIATTRGPGSQIHMTGGKSIQVVDSPDQINNLIRNQENPNPL